MSKSFRIATGALVVNQNAILLARYAGPNNSTYLVGPGGGVFEEEDMHQAVVREVQEESGLLVQPHHIVLVEDIVSRKYRMTKTWFWCSLLGGQLTKTAEADHEGILDINWYTQEALAHETVYPRLVKEVAWQTLASATWQSPYSGLTQADF